MDIVLATNNQHKQIEIQGILKDLGVVHTLVQPKEIGFSFDVVEDGTSFAENARKKAVAVRALLTGTLLPGTSVDIDPEHVARAVAARWGDSIPPVLADDSGICVDALDNGPGIFSARYGNQEGTPPLSDSERNALLLRTLANAQNRGAHYVCNAVLIVDSERYVQAEDVWHGSVTEAAQDGDTGFGYDPIFLLPDLSATVAQIPQALKNRISHRAKAIGSVVRAMSWTGGSGA